MVGMAVSFTAGHIPIQVDPSNVQPATTSHPIHQLNNAPDCDPYAVEIQLSSENFLDTQNRGAEDRDQNTQVATVVMNLEDEGRESVYVADVDVFTVMPYMEEPPTPVEENVQEVDDNAYSAAPYVLEDTSTYANGHSMKATTSSALAPVQRDLASQFVKRTKAARPRISPYAVKTVAPLARNHTFITDQQSYQYYNVAISAGVGRHSNRQGLPMLDARTLAQVAGPSRAMQIPRPFSGGTYLFEPPPSVHAMPCAIDCIACQQTMCKVNGIPHKADIISILEVFHIVRPPWEVLSLGLTFFEYLHAANIWPVNFRYRSVLDQVVFAVLHIYACMPWTNMSAIEKALAAGPSPKDSVLPNGILRFVCPIGTIAGQCSWDAHRDELQGRCSFTQYTQKIRV